MEAVSSDTGGLLNFKFKLHICYLSSQTPTIFTFSLTYKVLLNVSKNIIMGDTPTRSASYILILWRFGATFRLNKRHKCSSKRGCVTPV